MKRLHLPLVLLSLIFSFPANAEDYRRGTIGFLTKNCGDAIQKETPEEFFKTECGKFIFPYVYGAFFASMKNHNLPRERWFKVNDKACETAIADENKRYIENLFCKDSEGDSIDIRSPIPLAFTISKWGEWLQIHTPEALGTPIFPNILKAINNGPHCEFLYGQNSSQAAIRPNKKLWEMSLQRSKEMKQAEENQERPSLDVAFGLTSVTPQSYKSCANAIKLANNDPVQFDDTDCGMIMSAFYAGMFINDTVETAQGECADDINRFHKYEILAKDLCLSKNMEVLEIAQKSLAAYEYSEEENHYILKNPYDFCKNEN